MDGAQNRGSCETPRGFAMTSKGREIDVESPQVITRRRFCKNDFCKHCNIVGSPIRWLTICVWFTSPYIKYAFFCIFPPARFLSAALKGIEKLGSLDVRGIDLGRDCKLGIVQEGDKGFAQLVKVLKENRVVDGEIQKIKIIEKKAVMFTQESPDITRSLVFEVDGEDYRISNPFDPTVPIRDLKNWVEDYFRKQLAYWMLGMLGIWLVANSVMLYLLNR